MPADPIAPDNAGSSTRPATMTDVARLAGVSAMTVSRALHRSGPVSDGARERVERAMAQLGYTPNAAARALASGRSGTIGVVAFDTSQHGPAAALLGVERAARELGYAVSISAMPELDRESMVEALREFRRRAFDGAIAIVPHLAAGSALAEASGDIPVVAVQGRGFAGVPVVSVDQRRGAHEATSHLLDLGHETVVHVAGPDDWGETDERVRGWYDALVERRRPVPELERGDWSAASGYAAAQRILASEDRPTAVFAANDQMALGVLHHLHERGLTAPEAVSLVGFDDIPEAAYFSPSLTTVRQDFDEIGRRGLRLLAERLSGADVTQVEEQIEPVLLVRASTAPPSGA